MVSGRTRGRALGAGLIRRVPTSSLSVALVSRDEVVGWQNTAVISSESTIVLETYQAPSASRMRTIEHPGRSRYQRIEVWLRARAWSPDQSQNGLTPHSGLFTARDPYPRATELKPVPHSFGSDLDDSALTCPPEMPDHPSPRIGGAASFICRHPSPCFQYRFCFIGASFAAPWFRWHP